MTKAEEIYHRFVRYEWEEISDTMKKSILEAINEALSQHDVSQQRELLLAFADYSDYRNDKSQYIARYMIDDFLEANNCG